MDPVSELPEEMWQTDLLQAVILCQSPCVSIAVNGDLHGSSFAHDTVCHSEISARQHQTLAHEHATVLQTRQTPRHDTKWQRAHPDATLPG